MRERITHNASGIAATTVTGTWLAALFLNVDWWLPLMLFGYIVIVPLVSILSGEEESEWLDEVSENDDPTATDSDDEREDVADALDRLRTRYANGDLTDEQFERKLDRLLETETPEDAAEWVDRRREIDQSREVDPDTDREPGRELGRER